MSYCVTATLRFIPELYLRFTLILCALLHCATPARATGSMRLHFAHFLREISDIDYDRDGFIIFDPVGDDQLSSRNFFLFLTARLVVFFFFFANRENQNSTRIEIFPL